MKLRISLVLISTLFSGTSFAQSVEERLEEIENRLSGIENLILTSTESQPISSIVGSEPKGILEVNISNKRFDEGTYEDSIWWDAEYVAIGLSKPARAIKGTLVFADLFQEPYFMVQVTIDEPIEPSGTVVTRGIGIDYNQFRDSHKWLRSNDLSDMSIWFEVSSVLYHDGSTQNFE